MNRRNVLVVAILAAVIGGGAWAIHAAREAGRELSLSGNVDIREVNLAFRVGGRLKLLAVDEGAKVHAGDLLGELDAEPYRIALADATANHAAIAAHKSLYRAGYRAEDVAQAQANLRAREAAQADAEQLYQRQRKLANTGATTERAIDDAKAQRDQAAALTEAARQAARGMERGFRKEEVAEVSANEERAGVQIDQAKLQLSDTRLLAPSDGTILTRAVEPGAMLAAGATVFTLSLDKPVWVRAYAAEPDLGKVPPGTAVKIHTDSRKEPYDGTIGFVSPTAEFTPKNVETQDLRTALVYRLRVIVANPDAALRQGMPVTVTLAH
ncbi:MAG TPA: secretion protein HlyD [Burkholderiaceae bacterium]